MNKKANTLLFILGATLFNVLVAIISFVVLTLLYVKFSASFLSENTGSWPFSLIFLISIVISFFVYRLVLRFLLVKVDVEKYFDPLFVRKHKTVKKD